MPRPKPKPRFERQLADARRHALIEAAIASLKRHGHEGLSIRSIAAEAGVSLGLINHHFPNKEVLVAEAYSHFHRKLIDVHIQAVARSMPMPKPACGTEPNLRKSRYHSNASFGRL